MVGVGPDWILVSVSDNAIQTGALISPLVKPCCRYRLGHSGISGLDCGSPSGDWSVADQGVQRRLAAILAADVVGYSRMIGLDETGTLTRLRQVRHEIVNPVLTEHGGRVFKLVGDGLLAEFPSAVQALRAAIGIQERIRARNEQSSEVERIEVRIGVHQGDVVVEGRDLLGDGVNIAARLEALAEPGGICLSARVHEDAVGKVAIDAQDMGEQTLKNIDRPVHAYRVSVGGSPATSPHADEGRPGHSLSDRPSIAVLPFQNMSGDPEQEYFADGLTEDIITELSRIGSLSVTARTSTFVYKGKAIDVKQVGRELGVRYVLEGSVRRVHQRIRVTAQLVETDTGLHLWAEKYDRDLADIFEVQDEITRSVVGSTQTQVVLSEGDLAERTERPDFRTWDLAKRGWKKIYALTNESLEEGRKIAGELTRIDPTFAKGHQLLAVASYHLALMGFCDDPQRMLESALASIQKSLKLNDRDEYSHWIMGGILGQGLGQHDKSIAAYQRALDLNPNFSLAFGSLGSVLALAGRPEESIRNSQISIRSNPRDPSIFFRFASLALAHFVTEDYAKAREWAAKAVERKREWWMGHALLAASCACLQDEDAAHSAIRDWLEAFPHARVGRLPPIPLKHADHRERFLAGIRKAGLPE